jgi:hypothetical protein
MKKLAAVMAMLAISLLAGCTSQPEKPAEKPQPKGPELLTGLPALHRLYLSAHGWARDAQPYRLESQITADGTGKDGKAAVWRAGFASPAQRGVKPYIWSGSTAPDAPGRGINPGTEDNYNPQNSNTQVFDIAFFKIDSDKAFEVSQKHGGDKVLEKSADTPISYVLDWSRPTNELLWHVIYGESRESAKLRVAVNASTGDFIRVEK